MYFRNASHLTAIINSIIRFEPYETAYAWQWSPSNKSAYKVPNSFSKNMKAICFRNFLSSKAVKGLSFADFIINKFPMPSETPKYRIEEPMQYKNMLFRQLLVASSEEIDIVTGIPKEKIVQPALVMKELTLGSVTDFCLKWQMSTSQEQLIREFHFNQWDFEEFKSHSIKLGYWSKDMSEIHIIRNNILMKG